MPQDQTSHSVVALGELLGGHVVCSTDLFGELLPWHNFLGSAKINDLQIAVWLVVGV